MHVMDTADIVYPWTAAACALYPLPLRMSLLQLHIMYRVQQALGIIIARAAYAGGSQYHTLLPCLFDLLEGGPTTRTQITNRTHEILRL